MNVTRWCGGAAIAIGLGACNNGTEGTSDAAVDVQTRDVLYFDGSAGPRGTCDLGDGGVAPQGTQLVVSPKVELEGVTSDDHALYYDRALGELFVIALGDGGAPEQIGPSWDSTSTGVGVVGSVIYYWTGIPDFTKTPYLGQLVEWSAAGHAQALSAASFPGLFAASVDGKYIVYSDGAVSTFSSPEAGVGSGTTDIVVANADGTNKQKIASSVPWDPNCVPYATFIGDNVVVTSCAVQNLPQPAATIRSYAPPSWQATVLNTNPAYAGASIGGDDTTLLYYATSSAGLFAQNVPMKGPPVFISYNVASTLLTHDGTRAIFLTYDGYVHSEPVTGGASFYLSFYTFNTTVGLHGLSPDDKWLLVSRFQDTTTGLYDLDLLSTTTSFGNPTTLVSATNAADDGDWFTVDSAYAIFGANCVPAPYQFYGDTAVAPMSNPIDTNTLAHRNWSAWSGTGSKVVYNDDYDIVYPALPTGDIHAIDLATTTPATLLVSHADATFYLTADKKRVVYSWTYCANPNAGLYVLNLP